MPLLHMAEVVDATGAIASEWKNDTSVVAPPTVVQGHTFVDITERGVAIGQMSAAGYVYQDGAWVLPPDLPRMVTRGAFLDRFSVETQMALEEIAEGHNQAGRLVRIFTRRLEAENELDLNAPVLVASLAEIGALLKAAQVPGWEDDAAVAASMAGILA